MAITTLERHLAAVESGVVTKTNVTGIKMLLNAAWRADRGYSSRLKVSSDDVRPIVEAIDRVRPIVAGELVESGRKLLQSKRWRGRFTDRQREIIAADDLQFRLLRYDDVGQGNATNIPVYMAESSIGCFAFRNIPWQTAFYCGFESGPTLESL